MCLVNNLKSKGQTHKKSQIPNKNGKYSIYKTNFFFCSVCRVFFFYALSVSILFWMARGNHKSQLVDDVIQNSLQIQMFDILLLLFALLFVDHLNWCIAFHDTIEKNQYNRTIRSLLELNAFYNDCLLHSVWYNVCSIITNNAHFDDVICILKLLLRIYYVEANSKHTYKRNSINA